MIKVKKITVILAAILTMVFIGFVSVSNLVATEASLYKTVTSDLLKEKQENQDSFIAYFYQKNCAPCQQVRPIINDYIEETQNEVLAVDINEDENKNLLIEGFDINSTPIVIFVDSGKEQERFSSVFGEEEFKERASKVYSDDGVN